MLSRNAEYFTEIGSHKEERKKLTRYAVFLILINFNLITLIRVKIFIVL